MFTFFLFRPFVNDAIDKDNICSCVKENEKERREMNQRIQSGRCFNIIHNLYRISTHYTITSDDRFGLRLTR